MGEIAGSHTNGTMGDASSANRDVKNHMLFEIATEVANRGSSASDCVTGNKTTVLTKIQSVESTQS
jgi:hypothetical protein